jgi:hypothetical protein
VRVTSVPGERVRGALGWRCCFSLATQASTATGVGHSVRQFAARCRSDAAKPVQRTTLD